ncbi:MULTISPECIES: dihydrofolate reductase [Brucella]|uniref:Dihydrofolate reductase n=1 Tax=Brucella lupini TaxID=255457 RepID=A0A256GX17_9HYPH|nr:MULTISPECIES: dihydrofolate reductase [Brucella]RNL43412.1 dihydrofolate reductase [Ochrobactrum sp. MH181795]KAB2702681.1 dihydrofolate reductase [Brucella lupini]KAB2728700.1 dihydrofolate reductase [Brucella anthropi]KAB2745873.1 dihydrofolate reductase [Brucella anthropi]KAB2806298.1 dihydrofolate reductase [Brucella anthropi]
MSVQEPIVSIIVAAAENGVIGRDNDMPWRLSTDLKRFKALTLGKPVIMGRRTWESIGRPLPGRPNIVVTRDNGFQAEGASAIGSLEEAIALGQKLAADLGVEEVCVIGGGKIYAQALPLADHIHLTRVLAEIDGDTHFPEIDLQIWRVVSQEDVPAGDKDSHPTRYFVYEKRAV